jgi:hypothetical protein
MSARTVLVALTVILAAPAAAETGDDYTNNLFSDIAPYANSYIPTSLGATADRCHLGCWRFSESNSLNNS